MANTPPGQSNSTAAPRNDPFRSSFGLPSTIMPRASPVFGPLATIAGFGGTQDTTSSPFAFAAISSNPLSPSFSQKMGFGVQQTSQGRHVNGGTPWTFRALSAKDGTSVTTTEEYQTITFQDPYKDYSVEELRSADYELGRGATPLFGSADSATARKSEDIPTPLECLNNNNIMISSINSDSAPLLETAKPDPIAGALLFPSSKGVRIPKKQAMQLGRDVITIHIGEDPDVQSFTVHQALICARSNLLRDAMNGNSKEAQEKTVHLPEDDPAVFALYEQLLYSGCLPSDTGNGSLDDMLTEYASLCSLYVLGKKLQDEDAKRVAIEALLDMSRTITPNGQRVHPILQHVEIIYYGTNGPCGARRLLVDIYMYRASEDWLEKRFPPQFVFDLAKKALGNRCTTIDTTLTCKVSDYYDTDEGTEMEL